MRAKSLAMTERPLSIAQVAEYLGCSPSHVRNLCANGTIRHFRLGRLVRIPAAALRELEGDAPCGSSGSAEPITPTGARTTDRAASRFAPRIVRSPNDA